MPFQFVPAYVENMATAALEYLPGCTLVNVVALGSYSAYEYTFAKEGYEPVSKRLGYDFGLPLPEDQRGRALAQQFEGLFVDTAKVEQIEAPLSNPSIARLLETPVIEAQRVAAAMNEHIRKSVEKQGNDEPAASKSRRGNKGGK